MRRVVILAAVLLLGAGLGLTEAAAVGTEGGLQTQVRHERNKAKSQVSKRTESTTRAQVDRRGGAPTAASLPPEVYYPANVAYEGYFDDGSWGPLPIGFNFTFFDSTYTEFYVTSNGYIAFDSVGLEIDGGSGWSEYGNNCIPDNNIPNGYVAAFFTDLIIHENGGVIYYQTIGEAPNRKCVVQCTNIGSYSSPTLLGTFLFILYEATNEIQIQYRIIVDNASSWAHGDEATIGLENADGTSGVQYACYEMSLSSEQAIRFVPDGGGSYTIDTTALYDGILLGDGYPPSIPQLIMPAQLSTVPLRPAFEWQPCDYTDHYNVYVSENSTLEGAVMLDPGAATSCSMPSDLTGGTTYYWAVFAVGADGTITWSEIREFEVSDDAPPTAVPQTIWTTLGADAAIDLNGTGGQGSLSFAITTLPLHGTLYQYADGVRGDEIASAPTAVTDLAARVIFTIDDDTIGSNRGNFQFTVTDTLAQESDPATVLVHVYPAPTVVTAMIAITGPTAATSGGDITFDGGFAVTARGLCWSTARYPTIAGDHTSDGTGTGAYVSEMTGLTPGERYYVRAYAQNSAAIGYGNELSFMAGSATVTTAAVDSIESLAAVGGGDVTSDGGSELVERGVCWATWPFPTITDDHSSDGAATGAFVSHLTNLLGGTTYYVRAYVTNDYCTSYGANLSFTTDSLWFVIAGRICNESLEPIDSVVMSGLPGDPMTDEYGAYRAAVPTNWSGVVIPTRETFTFTPDSTAYEAVMANFITEDYEGTESSSGVDPENGAGIPRDYELAQNYPNPFNPATEIAFALPRGSEVTIGIYGILGQEVTKLVDRYLPAGSYRMTWSGTDSRGDKVASGVYLYRIVTPGFTQSKKMLLLK